MNRLYLIVGTSGSGKTVTGRHTIERELVSFTTRKQRIGEVDGVDYHFITKEEYEDLKEQDLLAEWAEYSGNFYGITKEEIKKKTNRGSTFAVVEMEGFKQLKALFPDAIGVFIHADKETVVRNMNVRGDNEDLKKKRLSLYEQEAGNESLFDYVVINRHGYFEDTLEQMRKIIIETGGEIKKEQDK